MKYPTRILYPWLGWIMSLSHEPVVRRTPIPLPSVYRRTWVSPFPDRISDALALRLLDQDRFAVAMGAYPGWILTGQKPSPRRESSTLPPPPPLEIYPMPSLRLPSDLLHGHTVRPSPHTLEDAVIVAHDRMIAVIYHHTRQDRLLVDLGRLPGSDIPWSARLIDVLHHGPCASLSIEDSSETIRLILRTGQIVEYTPSDAQNGTRRGWFSRHVYDTGHAIHTVASHQDLVVVGDGSPMMRVYARRASSEPWRCLGVLDHGTRSGISIRACAIRKFSQGFVNDSSLYRILSMDQNGHVSVWELRNFPSTDQIRIECLRNDITDALPYIPLDTIYTESKPRIVLSRQVWTCTVQQNRVRVYTHESLDHDRTLAESPYMECIAPSSRNSQFFVAAGRMLICVYENTVEMWDLDLVRYTLSKPLNELPSSSHRSVQSSESTQHTCRWIRVDPPVRPKTASTKPIPPLQASASDMIPQYLTLAQWMSPLGMPPLSSQRNTGLFTDGRGDAPSSDNS